MWRREVWGEASEQGVERGEKLPSQLGSTGMRRPVVLYLERPVERHAGGHTQAGRHGSDQQIDRQRSDCGQKKILHM